MRKPRLLIPGARYHVTARINNRALLLRRVEAKELFLSILRRARRKYSFRIDNFCIMENHVHFILCPQNGECLSNIMRWILGVFASALNRLVGRSGHLWGDRFHSWIIRNRRAFLEIMEYIDMNPVKAALADRVGDWEYCGMWHRHQGRKDILGTSPPECA
jgi:putative transposase